MSSDGRIRMIIYGLAISVVVLLTMTMGLFVVLVFSRSSQKVEGFKNYQHFQVNAELDSVSFGTVRIPEMNYDYEYFEDYSGNDVLVSEFGLGEFYCTGSCYCEDYRRDGSIAISRGLSYLLAAASTLIAFRIVENSLQDDCVSELLDESCSEHSITSHIDECFPLTELNLESDDDEGSRRTYLCSGNCESVNDGSDYCENINQEVEVTIFAGDDVDEVTMKDAAERKFVEENLRSFCVSNSLVPNSYDDYEEDLSYSWSSRRMGKGSGNKEKKKKNEKKKKKKKGDTGGFGGESCTTGQNSCRGKPGSKKGGNEKKIKFSKKPSKKAMKY